MVGFAVQVRASTERTKRRADYVWREANRKMIAAAQTPATAGGRMPIKTGFLQNSLVTTIRGSTSLMGAYAFNEVINRSKAGHHLSYRWIAPYARFQNNGYLGRPGWHWAETAASMWRDFVFEATRESRGMR